MIVAFGVTPLDRAAAAKTISITTTPKVTGAWVWIQHDDGRWALDFRTKGYWPANTKVHVQANVYGMKFADGAYGAGDLTSDFTIGRNQVVKADVNSHDLLAFATGKRSPPTRRRSARATHRTRSPAPASTLSTTCSRPS